MKNTLLLFLVSLITAQYFGQELPVLISPSPTASSIAQFADLPVSEYTGLPNIDVPIYTIKSGSLTVPISLQYHGGGIKAAQEASWVGLGWSLKSGGSISRIIKGNDDLDFSVSGNPSGEAIPYIGSTDIPDEGSSEIIMNSYYKNIVYDRIDPEPDIFFFNFGSYSGKFILEKPVGNENEIVGRLLDAQAIKILYLRYERLWKITDPTGINYKFSVTETTKNYSYSVDSALSIILANRNLLQNSGGNAYPVVTTWYIKEISSPTSIHKITFDYENDLHNTKSQIRVNEIIPRILQSQTYCNSGGSPQPDTSPNPPKKIIGSIDVTQDVYLSKINFSNGQVIFSTGNREDLEAASSSDPKPQRLNAIKVFENLNTIPIVEANLNYDYFQANANHGNKYEYYRLKLDSININDQNYEFDYNDPENLTPSKVTLDVDHWGYFNNAGNGNRNLWGESGGSFQGTLIPAIRVKFGSGSLFLDGADRYPKEDFTKYFVLEKIILPTGGAQRFNWEPNEYYGTKIEENSFTGLLPNSNLSTMTTSSGAQMLSYESDEFVVDDAGEVKLNVNFLIQKIDNPDYIPNNDEHPYVGLYKWDNGTWNLSQLPYLLYYDIYGNNSVSLNLNYENVYKTLSPGRYKMKMSHLDNLRIAFTWSYTEIATTSNASVKGAGLRIRSIVMDDEIQTIEKEFQYLSKDLSRSSGTPMDNPIYYFKMHLPWSVYSRTNANSTCLVSGDYIIGNSNNLLPLSSTGESFIGYSCVRSSYKGLSNQGETISEYYNFKPVPQIQNPPPNFPNQTDPKNGKPFRVTIKNKGGTTIEEKNYLYKIEESFKKDEQGMFVWNNSFTNLLPPFPYEFQPLPVYLSFFRHSNYSDWCYLESQTSIQYDFDGSNPVTTRTEYSYENDDHLQLTKTETIKSDGKRSITKMFYPDDVITSSSLGADNLTSLEKAALDKLKVTNLHRVSEPVQTESYKDENENGIADPAELISRQRTNYKEWSTDLILPEYIQSAKANNILEDRVLFHDYYDNGNLKEVSKKDGTNVVYMWGYNYEYPIAKIENVTYAEIAQALSITETILKDYDENNLVQINSLRQLLPTAMVSTYTYNPLVGISNVTDPKGDIMYYEYDQSNRLEQVWDVDGSILSRNEYNYKQ